MSALDTLLYGYRTILAATVAAAQRGKLNFSSAFTVADNAGTESTDVGLSGTQSITTATITTATLTTATLGYLALTPENNNLTGSQNDLVIGAAVSVVRFTNAGGITMTGLAGGAAGRVVVFINDAAGTVQINHEDAASVAANRFVLLGAANFTVNQYGCMLIVYNAASSRWHLITRTN